MLLKVNESIKQTKNQLLPSFRETDALLDGWTPEGGYPSGATKPVEEREGGAREAGR